MIDSEVEKFINKPYKLSAVECTRDPLRPRERQLNGEQAKPGTSSCGAELHLYLVLGITP
jgi:hypothetical protein